MFTEYNVNASALAMQKPMVQPAEAGADGKESRVVWIRNGSLRVFIGTVAILGRIKNNHVIIKNCEEEGN